MKGEYPLGATPLTPEEEEGLIPAHITLRSELNELEQANILNAEIWLSTGRSPKTVADSAFLKELHRRMFGLVWKWAGEYRKSDRNIGVHWPKISYETEALFREVVHWRNEKIFPPDDLAVRFHHKLVWIHCFPNGNGRHSRLAADLFGVTTLSFRCLELDQQQNSISGIPGQKSAPTIFFFPLSFQIHGFAGAN